MTAADTPYRWPIGTLVRIRYGAGGRTWRVEAVSESGHHVTLRRGIHGETMRTYVPWTELVEVAPAPAPVIDDPPGEAPQR